MMFLYGLGNRNAFKEVRKLCIWDAGLRDGIRKSCGKQLVYYGNADLPKHPGGVKSCKAKRPVEASKAKVIVSEKGVLEAAGTYAGKKVCIINAASPKAPPKFDRASLFRHPTWEEQLCSCTTLYPALTARKAKRQFYDSHNAQGILPWVDDCIYTPDVTVLREGVGMPLMPRNSWYQVNVISCVPPNVQKDNTDISSGQSGMDWCMRGEELKGLFRGCFCRILDIAKLQGNNVVIFGRLGCSHIAIPEPHVLTPILMPDDIIFATDPIPAEDPMPAMDPAPSEDSVPTTVPMPTEEISEIDLTYAAASIGAEDMDGQANGFLIFPEGFFEAAREAVKEYIYDFEAIEFAFGCPVDGSYSKILTGQ